MTTSIGLVDHHSLFRQGITTLLQQLHYTVSIDAAGGDDFIQQIEQHPPPDLVLLDTRLQDTDSYSLLQWIKQHYPGLPVVAMHHKNDFHLLIQLLRGGASAHLSKTASPAEVHRTLQEVLVNHRTRTTGK